MEETELQQQEQQHQAWVSEDLAQHGDDLTLSWRPAWEKHFSLSWENHAGYLEAEVLILWNPNCLREQDFRARLVVKLLTA